MRVVAVVALNVFRESVRDKVLYSLVVFAVLMIAASYLIGQLSAGQDLKIIKDLGLAAISVFGLAIAIFIGIGLVWKEVERRSIYALLVKPLTRGQFVCGKYCGLVLTLIVNVSVMTVAFYAVLVYMASGVLPEVRAAWPAPAADPAMLEAILLIVVELMLVTAIALFFSTFSSPFLSAVLTAGLWVIGHFNEDLRNFEKVLNSRVASTMAKGAYYLLPNFAAFDVKAQVVHGQPVPMSYVALTSLYGLVYVVFVLVGAVAVFARRDFR
jgi:ABC-type transport system involved in multi-copper enzyme maturation permease subunit